MKPLSTLEEWEEVKKLSFHRPEVIYIHSLACPISRAAHGRISGSPLNDSAYILAVQTAARVSAAVERDLEVRHQSPQVIVIKDGKAIYSADHWEIEPERILSILSEHKKINLP